MYQNYSRLFIFDVSYSRNYRVAFFKTLYITHFCYLRDIKVMISGERQMV